MTWLSTSEMEEMLASHGEPSYRTWEREYMQRWCPGPAVAQKPRLFGSGPSRYHLLPCRLLEGHEGKCNIGSGNPWLHHNCKNNGCLNPELMDQYVTEDMHEDHRASSRQHQGDPHGHPAPRRGHRGDLRPQRTGQVIDP